jgi:regulator of sirC expression with transglutaminase-like and TPR domain
LKGSLYVQSGNAPQAEGALRRSLALDPKMAKSHLALVNLYLQLQRKSDAIAELKIFLKSSPRDPFAPQARRVLERLQGTAAEPKPN